MQPSPSPPSPGSDSSPLDPLVISLVGIFCSIFLIFSYYRIIQQNCMDFSAIALFRNSGRARHLSDQSPDDLSLEFQSRALDSFVMHSLPIIQFKKKKEQLEEESHQSTDCAVCLVEFEDGDWIKQLPNCSHVFHVACIDTWFQTHSSCPLCRSYVYFATPPQHTVSALELLESSPIRLDTTRAIIVDHPIR